ARVMSLPIGIIHLIGGDADGEGISPNHLAVPDVDRHMGEPGEDRVAEKEDVSRHQIAFGYLWRAAPRHGNIERDVDAVLVKDEVDQANATEAGGGIADPGIGGAKILLGSGDDISGTG